MYFHSPHKRISRAYIVALSIILALLIVSQVLIHSKLQEQIYDSKTVNLSGRQRMLSQKITKLALLTQKYNNHKTKQEKVLKELKKALQLFTSTHNTLLKADTLMKVSPKNKENYAQLKKPYSNLVEATESILVNPNNEVQLEKSITRIALYEAVFLKYMNRITFQYEREARENVRQLDLVELILLLLTLFVIFLEGLLIFRPIVRYLKRYFDAVNEKNKELRELYQEVSTSLETISTQTRSIRHFHQNISLSIDYAKRIQNATLTPIEEVKTYLSDSFIFWKPRDNVSGDFYFFTKKTNKTIFAMVDCTGHGVPGAFMSMIVHEMLNNIINTRHITQPANILNKLRTEIRKRLNQDNNDNTDGLEIALCAIIDSTEPPYLEYAGSNRPLLYFQGEEARFIKGDKIIIGGFSNFFKQDAFTQHRISLDKPTTLYIFSDGLQDQFGEVTGKKLGSRRFYDILKDIQKVPIKQQKALLEEKMRAWQGNYEQIDDMLLIGVEYGK